MQIPSAPSIDHATRLGGRDAFRSARRKAAWRALALALPLLVFLLATFVAPIAILLARSVQNPEVRSAMPALTRALAAWNGAEVPDEAAYAALAQGLRDAAQADQLGNVARRLNFYAPEFRSLMMKTARATRSQSPAAWRPVLIGVDERWGQSETRSTRRWVRMEQSPRFRPSRPCIAPRLLAPCGSVRR
jgi:putative spermidine/putrescine transport system permease protein